MTLERIDQLVFGYDEGHRLLGGSTDIPARALAHLLGATDSPLDSSTDRLVTGFPLDEIARYALCFTWSAPEAPRLGAVWSHVLLIEPEHFESSACIGVLRELALRPEPRRLDSYSRRLSHRNGQTAVGNPSPSLIEAILIAEYGEGESVVVCKNLKEAEQALFAVWAAQWPELRSRFEFRTRESARVSSASGVVVARRVRGMRRQLELPQRKAWITGLADSISTKQGSPLRRFLETFGPFDTPEADTVRALAELYCHVESENCTAVREVLEGRYPDGHSGRELKEQLFGRPVGSWWTLTEAYRLGALLGASLDAWDLDAIEFESRLSHWIQRNGLHHLVGDFRQHGPESIREALLNALVRCGEPSDVVHVARVSPELAARWLAKRPSVGSEPKAWHGLEHDQVEAVFAALESPDAKPLLAAAIAGHATTAIEILGLSAALSEAIRAKDFTAATTLLEASSWADAVRVSEKDPEVTLILASISGGRDVPGILTALKARRDAPDETWLKAASVAVSRTDQLTGKVLEIVFGPLHHAITDDRLPSGCWEFLSRVLPEAPDPALRLRRFLIRVAKKEGWRHKKYRRALRGAGPYASELYREFDDDDLLLGRIRKFIESRQAD